MKRKNNIFKVLMDAVYCVMFAEEVMLKEKGVCETTY